MRRPTQTRLGILILLGSVGLAATARETVETVEAISRSPFTPLKRGVNGSRPVSAVGKFETSKQAVVGHAEVYQRTTNELAEAVFLKPANTNAEGLTFRLAPLVLQEVTPASAGFTCRDIPGAISPDSRTVSVEPARPVVYVHTDVAVIKGTPHARLAYLWFYPTDARTNGPIQSAQGIRLTLNSAGEPAIWEALADSTGLGLIFVSQNLESAARSEFGAPLPGRRYAAEAPLEKAGGVMVARVLDDGPLPMGPMVYLTAPSHDVQTVICRCMPAQVKKLARTVEYELRPWPGTMAPEPRAAFWPGRAERPLEERLRLPGKF